jgi:hypothetical protein
VTALEKKRSFKMNPDWVKGVLDAAAVAAEYDSSSTHPYRLEDCIACKLNVVGRAKPRKNTRRVKDPNEAWLMGAAMTLGEMYYADGRVREVVQQVARALGITLKSAKAAGCDAFDLKRLRAAGVAPR